MSVNEITYLGDMPILYLDISSTCTGWVVASTDTVNKTVTVHKAGVFWYEEDSDLGSRYKYLINWISNVAYPYYMITGVVAEGYMVNFAKRMGALVVPEFIGAVKAICHEPEPPLDFKLIYPQQWRAAIGIKKDAAKAGSAAWKEPTKVVIEKILNYKFPAQLLSNINGKKRKVPYDLFDAFGVCLGWNFKDPNNCNQVILKPDFLIGEIKDDVA